MGAISRTFCRRLAAGRSGLSFRQFCFESFDNSELDLRLPDDRSFAYAHRLLKDQRDDE